MCIMLYICYATLSQAMPAVDAIFHASHRLIFNAHITYWNDCYIYVRQRSYSANTVRRLMRCCCKCVCVTETEMCLQWNLNVTPSVIHGWLQCSFPTHACIYYIRIFILSCMTVKYIFIKRQWRMCIVKNSDVVHLLL